MQVCAADGAFGAVATTDEEARSVALDSLLKCIRASLTDANRTVDVNLNRCLLSLPCSPIECEVPLNIVMLVVSRLAARAPFADVRERCRELLNEVV